MAALYSSDNKRQTRIMSAAGAFCIASGQHWDGNVYSDSRPLPPPVHGEVRRIYVRKDALLADVMGSARGDLQRATAEIAQLKRRLAELEIGRTEERARVQQEATLVRDHTQMVEKTCALRLQEAASIMVNERRKLLEVEQKLKEAEGRLQLQEAEVDKIVAELQTPAPNSDDFEQTLTEAIKAFGP